MGKDGYSIGSRGFKVTYAVCLACCGSSGNCGSTCCAQYKFSTFNFSHLGLIACIGYGGFCPRYDLSSLVEAMGNGIKVKYLEGQIVNANVPVLLQANTATAYSAEPILESEEAATFAGNILQGTLTDKDVMAESGQKIYVLNIGSKGVGFYWQKDTDGSKAKIGAGHAYLSRPFTSGGVQGFSLVDPIVTGVEAVETQNTEEDAPIYDLSGRRVIHPTHGIYIIGGKKVMR